MIASDAVLIVRDMTMVTMIARIIAPNSMFLPLLRAIFFKAFVKMYIFVPLGILSTHCISRLAAGHITTDQSGYSVGSGDMRLFYFNAVSIHEFGYKARKRSAV